MPKQGFLHGQIVIINLRRVPFTHITSPVMLISAGLLTGVKAALLTRS